MIDCRKAIKKKMISTLINSGIIRTSNKLNYKKSKSTRDLVAMQAVWHHGFCERNRLDLLQTTCNFILLFTERV